LLSFSSLSQQPNILSFPPSKSNPTKPIFYPKKKPHKQFSRNWPSNGQNPPGLTRPRIGSVVVFTFKHGESCRSNQYANDIGYSVLCRGSSGGKEANLVGCLLGGAGEEGENSTDPNRVALEKWIAGEGG
jgi:hypothetical protein